MQPGPDPGEVTRLLAELRAGEAGASERLISLVYGDLHRLASACMRREQPGHTLQTTAVVHEAYLRLVGAEAGWEDRAHFFGVAARIMRQVLVDHARRRIATKRGNARRRVALNETLLISEQHLDDVLAVDGALEKLARIDPRQSRLVEMRFFAGLSVEEIARCLQISTPTVKREWRSARAWLRREMTGVGSDDSRTVAAG
jgi:RNA polymerase sigma-70 factor (ECF subfamily)